MVVRTTGLFAVVQALIARGLDPVAALRERGYDPERWSLPEESLTWDEYVEVLDIIAELLGGLDAFREFRTETATALEHTPIGRLSRLAGDLMTLYRLVYEWYGQSTYPMHDATIMNATETGFDLKIRLNPRGRGSAAFFHNVWGSLQVLPSVAGLPPANVQATMIDDRRFDYRVELPDQTGTTLSLDSPLNREDRQTIIDFLLGHSSQLRYANASIRAALRQAERRELALVEANRLRAAAEHDLAAQERAALEANHLATLGQFASGIAHDFSNLMMIVMGNVSLVLADGLSPQARRAGESILDAVELATTMVDRLMTFASHGTTEIETFDLNDALEARMMLLERLLSDVHMDLRIDETIPPVRGDPDRLVQALTNLALNAQEAMPGGGRLTISTTGEADRAVVTVSDTGPGMQPDLSELAFTPFFTTKDRGTGLGLPSTREAIESMGGHISMTTAPGEGTTFRLELPLAEAPLAEAPAAEAPAD